jgi:hypothetical protein
MESRLRRHSGLNAAFVLPVQADSVHILLKGFIESVLRRHSGLNAASVLPVQAVSVHMLLKGFSVPMLLKEFAVPMLLKDFIESPLRIQSAGRASVLLVPAGIVHVSRRFRDSQLRRQKRVKASVESFSGRPKHLRACVVPKLWRGYERVHIRVVVDSPQELRAFGEVPVSRQRQPRDSNASPSIRLHHLRASIPLVLHTALDSVSSILKGFVGSPVSRHTRSRVWPWPWIVHTFLRGSVDRPLRRHTHSRVAIQSLFKRHTQLVVSIQSLFKLKQLLVSIQSLFVFKLTHSMVLIQSLFKRQTRLRVSILSLFKRLTHSRVSIQSLFRRRTHLRVSIQWLWL